MKELKTACENMWFKSCQHLLVSASILCLEVSELGPVAQGAFFVGSLNKERFNVLLRFRLRLEDHV